MFNLAVLGSTRGTHLLTLLDAIEKKQLEACIKVVISNKSDALILQRAEHYKIPAFFMNAADLTSEQYEENVAKKLADYPIDLIVLAGYMRILSPAFVSVWENKIINIHPSLLPDFSGGMSQDVHRAVLASGMTETGCTVHWVTAEVDAGPHILQKKCSVFPGDTVESLKERVQKLEAETLVEVLNSLLAGDCVIE